MFFSIIYLNYNRSEDIVLSLKNLFDQSFNDFEVIVIDNNSKDDSIKRLNEEFGGRINLVSSKINLGVAGGRNLGAKLAKAENLLFMDDDAHFKSKKALHIIKEYLNQTTNIGVVGFKVLDVNNKIRDWVYNSNTLQHANTSFSTNQFVGCCFVVKRKLFHDLNGFSKELFFWGEEIELCLKIFLKTNYDIIYYHKIEVVHRVSPNSRLHWSGQRTYYKTRNRMILINSYFSEFKFIKIFLKLYFGVAYFILAISHNALTSYFKALKESGAIKIELDKDIRKNRILKYLKIYFRQLIGKVNPL